MPLQTQSALETAVTVPIGGPAVTLNAGTWLVMANVGLDAGQAINITALEAAVLRSTGLVTDACENANVVVDANLAAFGLAAVYVVQDFVPDIHPASQTVLSILTVPADPASLAQIAVPVRNSISQAITVAPDEDALVSVVLANQTTNKSLTVVLTGCATITDAA